MSETIYEQVDDAIARGLHIGSPRRSPLGGASWDRPRRIENGDIVLRNSDCEPERSEYRIGQDEWADRVEKRGLWRKVGMWSFVEVDDPAADCIRWCNQYPDSAGRELFRLRNRVKDLLAR